MFYFLFCYCDKFPDSNFGEERAYSVYSSKFKGKLRQGLKAVSHIILTVKSREK